MVQQAKRKKAAAAIRNKHGEVVLWQRPNIWLIGWIICTVLFYSGAAGAASKYLFALGAVSLAVWAVLELLRGVNTFRRVLGAVVLLVLLALSKFVLNVVTG